MTSKELKACELHDYVIGDSNANAGRAVSNVSKCFVCMTLCSRTGFRETEPYIKPEIQKAPLIICTNPFLQKHFFVKILQKYKELSDKNHSLNSHTSKFGS